MIKKVILITLLVGLVSLLLVGAVNRTMAKSGEPGNSAGQDREKGMDWSADVQHTEYSNPQGSQGNGKGKNIKNREEHDSDILPPADLIGLSSEEAEGLLFMREEEKLARDVYLALSTKWDIPVFQNIAASEQVHMDAIEELLVRYSLPDPALAEPGLFTNLDLQALYNDLVTQGSLSMANALKVGGAVEEIDIIDLQAHLFQTDNADIQYVYENLLKGSQNHLRAFSGVFQTQTGETYQPQYMDIKAYDAIVLAAGQGGGKGNSWGGGGGRWGNQ
jgi:hypothetical protein